MHILPNNLPQFGILWQYAGAENICAWDYWHSPQLILLQCTLPRRQFSQFCNMQYMQYANLILLALSKTSAAYLAVSSYCSVVVDICAPQNNFNPKLIFWSTEKNPCQLFEGEYKIVSCWFSANTILSNHVFNCHHSLTMWLIVEWETEIKNAKYWSFVLIVVNLESVIKFCSWPYYHQYQPTKIWQYSTHIFLMIFLVKTIIIINHLSPLAGADIVKNTDKSFRTFRLLMLNQSKKISFQTKFKIKSWPVCSGQGLWEIWWVMVRSFRREIKNQVLDSYLSW